RDGVDSGGSYMSCPNVEWMELQYPLFYLFRRHAIDSAGAGKFRGGVAVESAHTLHDAPERNFAASHTVWRDWKIPATVYSAAIPGRRA
ncbi:MAG TPA: hydantoinase B/oxoprolinase family protein, partial [Lacipirellulaceae bacterium]|nr:hydantoinase B/oxoprolinase family protein [Lacipirellulaceae bacterium]